MTKTLAPECKWPYLRNISAEKRTSPTHECDGAPAKMLRGFPAATNALFFNGFESIL